MNRPFIIGIMLTMVLIASSCAVKDTDVKTTEPRTNQATSLLGEALTIPKRSEEAMARLNADLEKAQSNFDADPSEMNTIWLGRRYAYLSDYQQAISVFTNGIKAFPESYKLYRHRGHRYISIREFDKAIADYEKAYELMPKDKLETEPDGAPNKLNIPLSNTQFNILYHYGLAHYLKGDFEKADEIYSELIKDYCDNLDLYVATADWLYMTKNRLGKKEEASQILKRVITDWNVLKTAEEVLDIANAKMIEKILSFKTEVVENDSYLKRLQFYNNELVENELMQTSGDDAALSLATQGYGLGNWYLYQGDTTKAMEIFKQVVEGSSWAAFGYIASEAELARMQ